jgi:hypothetical protein
MTISCLDLIPYVSGSGELVKDYAYYRFYDDEKKRWNIGGSAQLIEDIRITHFLNIH